MEEKVHRDPALAESLRRLREQVRAETAGKDDFALLKEREENLLYGDRDQVLLPDLRASLEEVNKSWQVREQPFVSRIPLVGRLIALFREMWNRISTKWYVLPILQQQVTYNAAVARALSNLYQYLSTSTLGLLRRMDTLTQALWEAQVAWKTQVYDEIDRRTGEWQEADRRLAEVDRQLTEALGQQQAEIDRLKAELQRMVGQVEHLAALEADNRRGYAFQRLWLERLMLRMAERPQGPPPQPVGLLEVTAPLADHDYFVFENAFRGAPVEIRARQEGYLPLFQGAVGPVLDVGCGRGEFLELLSEHGIPAYGIEINEQMLLVCREKGLDVRREDAFAHLSGLAEASLGGIFASHVLEHLPTDRLAEFVRLCFARLRPGAVFVAETPNPTCLWTFARQFYLDLSHTRPLHPLALQFLLEMAGFREVEVRYLNRVPPQEQLSPVPLWGEGVEREAAVVLQKNMARLNDLIYGYQDFAVVGRK